MSGPRGLHLIIDGYGCNEVSLSNLPMLEEWLNGLPPRIGMRVLSSALICSDSPPACSLLDSGITGFVLLAESHCSIHTWPERGEIQFDLYSCRPFDTKRVTREVKALFGISDMDITIVERRKR